MNSWKPCKPLSMIMPRTCSCLISSIIWPLIIRKDTPSHPAIINLLPINHREHISQNTIVEAEHDTTSINPDFHFTNTGNATTRILTSTTQNKKNHRTHSKNSEYTTGLHKENLIDHETLKYLLSSLHGTFVRQFIHGWIWATCHYQLVSPAVHLVEVPRWHLHDMDTWTLASKYFHAQANWILFTLASSSLMSIIVLCTRHSFS